MSNEAWLNYSHLFYFKTIALEGSIAKASAKLRLGQPTLSTQLKLLEESLGQKLFVRSRRSLKLTEPGQTVLNYALEIFKIGDEMIQVLKKSQTPNKVTLRIGIADQVPKYLALKVFQKIKDLKNCHMTIFVDRDVELCQRLQLHNLDLLLTTHMLHLERESCFISKRIAHMPVLVCGANKFAHLSGSFPHSLNSQAFILPTSNTRIRKGIENFFRYRGISPDVYAEVSDTVLQKLIATQGMGLIVAPKPAVEELLVRSDLTEIGQIPELFEELWLTTAHKKVPDPLVAEVMESVAI